MNLYKASYWTDGPGMSHTETVIIVAKNLMEAERFVRKHYAVRKVDYETIVIKKIRNKAMHIKYLDQW